MGMGTAPELWNTILHAMVQAVPRQWWKRRAFSQGLATFSKPLVALTDAFTGETHAMRVDVSGVGGGRVSAVQAHTSFRRCVGQSCAEFTLALLDARGDGAVGVAPEGAGGVGDPRDARASEQAAALREALPALGGVFLPEALFESDAARQPMLERLFGTPGTVEAAFEAVEAGETSPV